MAGLSDYAKTNKRTRASSSNSQTAFDSVEDYIASKVQAAEDGAYPEKVVDSAILYKVGKWVAVILDKRNNATGKNKLTFHQLFKGDAGFVYKNKFNFSAACIARTVKFMLHWMAALETKDEEIFEIADLAATLLSPEKKKALSTALKG